MPLLVWKQDFSVGVAQFDEQHKKLIGMVNDLYDAMKTGKAKEALGPLFDGLVEYTVGHFFAEEMLMQEHKYPGYAIHLREHKALTRQVLDFQDKFKQGSVALGVELLTFLTNWLKHHIKGTDKQYGVFFNGKGIH